MKYKTKHFLAITSIVIAFFLAFAWFGQIKLLGLSSLQIDEKLEIGMSKEQVIGSLGEPHYKSSFKGIEDHWTYRNAKLRDRNLEYPIAVDIYFDGNLVINYLKRVK